MRNDADVVAPSEGRPLSYRNIVYGAVLALVGIGGLIVGVSTSLIVVGVIAFLVMLGGVILAVTPAKGATAAPRSASASASAPRSSTRSGQSFMDRMNDRWDRRQDGH